MYPYKLVGKLLTIPTMHYPIKPTQATDGHNNGNKDNEFSTKA